MILLVTLFLKSIYHVRSSFEYTAITAKLHCIAGNCLIMSDFVFNKCKCVIKWALHYKNDADNVILYINTLNESSHSVTDIAKDNRSSHTSSVILYL